jgi:peroxiredoxin Q/BCP
MSKSVLFATIGLLTTTIAAGGDMLETGDAFPAFSLTAHDGSTVSSEGLAGQPYLVYYYPKADTPGCTKEACAFRDRWEDVQQAGLAVYGVSFDKPDKNAAFAKKYGLQFLLLSDIDRELAAEVGAKSAFLPVPKRISYLVGADGSVLKAYPKVSPSNHAGEVLADLEALTE